MTTFAEGLAQLTGAQGAGFDLGEVQASRLLNEGIRRFASRSKAIKAVVDLGATVADQGTYTLPAHVVELERLQVGDSPLYARTSAGKYWDLLAGYLAVPDGLTGMYAPYFNEDGTTKQISIFPTPTAAAAIVGLASITPAADLSGTDPIPFPEEDWRGALHAATALAYETIEENVEQATYFWERFDAAAEELRRKVNSRVGGGVTRFPVTL